MKSMTVATGYASRSASRRRGLGWIIQWADGEDKLAASGSTEL